MVSGGDVHGEKIGGIDYLLSSLILAPGQRAGFATKAPRHQGSLFCFCFSW
jgi:hypothetical protein